MFWKDQETKNQTKKQTNTFGRKGSETRKGPRMMQILLSQGFLRQGMVILSLSEKPKYGELESKVSS